MRVTECVRHEGLDSDRPWLVSEGPCRALQLLTCPRPSRASLCPRECPSLASGGDSTVVPWSCLLKDVMHVGQKP